MIFIADQTQRLIRTLLECFSAWKMSGKVDQAIHAKQTQPS
jgi:hypothetical protein